MLTNPLDNALAVLAVIVAVSALYLLGFAATMYLLRQG
jgi:hypothetical protein